ncbi:odorant receptor 9a-like [Leptopilina boulardi]|uniref:odorant receptor 9a-like n=1 Tax=Leptopilina boulardi TaxID=63433 RepID=UPI0021F680F3|nr:odorant receptor 9a-like [Leptopilina boulardi]
MEAYNSHMKINKYFLCATGLWPYQSKVTQKLISFFIWLSLISFLIPQILALINNWGNTDIVIQWLPPCFVNLLSISCYVPASINRNKIKLILSKMKEDWQLCESNSEFQILNSNGILSKNVNNAIYVFFYIAMLEFLTVPLIPSFLDKIKPLNESRPRRLIMVTDYLVDSNNYYAAIAAHHWHVSIITITLILTVDGIFRAFIYHACGQMEILGFKMKNIVKIDYNMDISDERNVQREIKFCIQKHKSVVMFVNQINDCFSTSYFMGLGFNMIMISFTGVQLIMKLDDPSETFAILSYTMSQILRLFSLTLPCQRLIDQSTLLSLNIYNSYWYNLSLESKNLLKIIMLRCMKPCTFTAGKLYTFSMSNFGVVVKTSISYFTVLLSLRN